MTIFRRVGDAAIDVIAWALFAALLVGGMLTLIVYSFVMMVYDGIVAGK